MGRILSAIIDALSVPVANDRPSIGLGTSGGGDGFANLDRAADDMLEARTRAFVELSGFFERSALPPGARNLVFDTIRTLVYSHRKDERIAAEALLARLGVLDARCQIPEGYEKHGRYLENIAKKTAAHLGAGAESLGGRTKGRVRDTL